MSIDEIITGVVAFLLVVLGILILVATFWAALFPFWKFLTSFF